MNEPVAPEPTNRVRQFREQLKLSAYGLAKKVGVAESTILRIETGFIKRPRQVTKEAIARELRSDVEDVFPS